jgi:hypothetical protein
LHALRTANDAEYSLGGDSECALTSNEDALEIVARCVGHTVLRAEPDELSRRKNNLATEHVGSGEAVLEAVRAASVFREVATNRADDLRRGVGRVEETGAANEFSDLGVSDTGFDSDESVFQIDGGHAIHAREADDDAAWCRQRAAA